jgi:hypothetical protein
VNRSATTDISLAKQERRVFEKTKMKKGRGTNPREGKGYEEREGNYEEEGIRGSVPLH